MNLPRVWVIVAALFAVLLVTNRWQDFGDGPTNIVAPDSGDYHAIAVAAPELPTARLPYHHVQRIAVPYAIGLGMKATGVGADVAFRVVSVVTFGLAIAVFCAALLRAGVSAPIVIAVAALYLFNPYVTRLHLTFSGLVTAAVYLAGLSAVIYAVVAGRWAPLFIGALVAAVARQTAMTFLPALLFLAWTRRRRAPIVTLVAIAAIYVVSGSVALAVGQGSINAGTLTGIFADIGRAAAPTFVRSWVEIATPLILPLTLLLFVRLTSALRAAWTPETTTLLLLACGALASPIMMGPTVALGNGARLSALAVPPVLAIAALVLHRAGAAWTRSWWFASVVTCCAVLASLHHVYSYGPSRWTFGALTVAAAAGMAVSAARAHATGVADERLRVGRPSGQSADRQNRRDNASG